MPGFFERRDFVTRKKIAEYIIGLSAGLGAALMLTAFAKAAPPAKTDPTLAPWFRSLHNPTIDISCCAESDGHILRDDQWRVAGDHYQIIIGGKWWDVPPDAVLSRVDNPTGGAVAFWLSFAAPDGPPRILCFVTPFMT